MRTDHDLCKLQKAKDTTATLWQPGNRVWEIQTFSARNSQGIAFARTRSRLRHRGGATVRLLVSTTDSARFLLGARALYRVAWPRIAKEVADNIKIQDQTWRGARGRPDPHRQLRSFPGRCLTFEAELAGLFEDRCDHSPLISS